MSFEDFSVISYLFIVVRSEKPISVNKLLNSFKYLRDLYSGLNAVTSPPFIAFTNEIHGSYEYFHCL